MCCLSGQQPALLHEGMRYACTNGGKRLRPLLVGASGYLFGARQSDLLQVAASVELVHCYSLVHDDMPCMDDDSLRRGKPAVHRQYGEAQAMLVGDALQTRAFEVLSQARRPEGCVLCMVQCLARACGSCGMAGGQSIDVGAVDQPFDLDQLQQMHAMKTGALIEASVALGAHCAQLTDDDDAWKRIREYGKRVGLLFQVVDDLLDATASTNALGKTAGKDAVQNKPTYVSLLGEKGARDYAGHMFQEANDILHPFGERARYLAALTHMIYTRKN